MPPSPLRPLVPGVAALLAAFLVAAALPAGVEAQSLRGSRASMDRQNHQARSHDYTFIRNPSQVRRFVELGYLVPIQGNRDYRLKSNVAFPYARPEVKVFLERLGRQYRSACGEQLVVTSLTRPKNRQPRNASPRTVHPTGMALDLRRSQRASCHRWLETTLLYLERRNLLEATREHRPPHYHVALFPKPYMRYVNQREGGSGRAVDDRVVTASTRYRVRRGDNLWRIAKRFDSSVALIRSANGMPGNTIRPGQVLTIPTR